MNERELLIVLEPEPDADSEEIEQLGRQLRNRLRELDVDGVQPMPASEAPDDAKGAAVDWGSLLLTLSATGGVFTSVITLARDWLKGHATAKRMTIKVGNDTIELERATTEEREQLINAWVKRHDGS